MHSCTVCSKVHVVANQTCSTHLIYHLHPLLQALCDQQNFEKADENFKKATEFEPDNANNYVHRG